MRQFTDRDAESFSTESSSTSFLPKRTLCPFVVLAGEPGEAGENDRLALAGSIGEFLQ